MSVYFINHGSMVKIGKSSDPDSRLKTLQTGTSLRLHVLAVAEINSEAESYEIERQLHEQFAWSRKRGEFFSSSLPLRQLIAAVASGMDVRLAMKLAEKSCRKHTHGASSLRACKLITPPVAENANRRRKRLRAEARSQA